MKNYSLNHSEFENDAVQITLLPNGLRVVTAKRPIHTVTVSAFTNVGSRFETEAENGLSHFLEHMAFKGTPTRTTKDISLQVERLGATTNAFTSHNVTAYYVRGLPAHIGSALDILSDVLMNSLLAPDEIMREQEVVLQEISESNDDIHDVAYHALTATAFPDQPLGRPILGPKENVLSFDHDIVSEYMKRHYHAANMIVLGVGNIDHDSFVTETTARFGNLATADIQPPVPAQYVGGVTVVKDTRYDQAHLFVAFPAPGSKDAEAYARYDLLSDILGSGMSSPLFQEVREKRGLCYSVSAGTSPQHDQSLFMIHGSTSAKSVNDFLTTACGELAKIAKGTIEDSDWERARNQIILQIVSKSENSSGVANAAASDLFILGRVRSMDEVVSIYMGISREEVIAAAKEMLTTVPTIVVAGNAKKANYAKLVSKALAA